MMSDQPDEPDRHSNPDDDWDAHWDTFGDAASENPANEYRLRLVLRALGDSLMGGSLLDIGSGQGALALSIASAYPHLQVRGVEYSLSGVRKARSAAAQIGVHARFDQRDLLTQDVAPNYRAWADSAVCSEVLEHLDDPRLFLENAGLYLKPGAKLVVTVPAGPRSALDRHIGHRRHYDPASLRQLLGDAGFRVMRVERAGFPFFNLYRLLVIARGKALIGDIDLRDASPGSGWRGRVLKYVSWGFATAFKLNTADTPLGWQLVAVAISPG